MATNLLKSKTKMTDKAETLAAAPAIATGLLTASTVIKAVPGLLLGYTMEMTDTGGDGTVEVWDSPTSDLTDDVCVARITVRSTTNGDMASFSLPLAPGVECGKGIYMKVTAGDVNVILYYK